MQNVTPVSLCYKKHFVYCKKHDAKINYKFFKQAGKVKKRLRNTQYFCFFNLMNSEKIYRQKSADNSAKSRLYF